MSPFLHRFYRAVRRVFPDCITQTQAVAFNIFVASFPMLLMVLGTVASSAAFQQALMGMVVRLGPLLPPGSIRIFSGLLSRHSTHPWQWVLVGSGGTLIAGTQMMKLLMEGFSMVHRDTNRQGSLGRHIRALLLLVSTIVPVIFIVNLVVFGKQLRNSMLHTSSMPVFIRLVWVVAYVVACLVIAMIVLAVIYRVGRPGPQHWSVVIPGAEVATVLWWVISIALGFYLRHVPYSIVYGGLAVTICLLIWMQITATILLIGAAYNAELQNSPR